MSTFLIYCDDASHPNKRQLVKRFSVIRGIVWTVGMGTNLEGDEPLEDDFELLERMQEDGRTVRGRHRFECPRCGLTVPIRGDKLTAIARRAVADSRSGASLTELA